MMFLTRCLSCTQTRPSHCHLTAPWATTTKSGLSPSDIGSMDPSSARIVGLDAQGNMVFTVVKPVMGIFQVSAEQTSSTAQADMGLQELSENALILPQAHGQATLDQNLEQMNMVQPRVHSQMQMCAPVQSEVTPQNQEVAANTSVNLQPSAQMPFAEVLSLLDPNMKGSKARKSLI